MATSGKSIQNACGSIPMSPLFADFIDLTSLQPVPHLIKTFRVDDCTMRGRSGEPWQRVTEDTFAWILVCDNDNDNGTQRSPTIWPYRRECRGHDPAKKNLLEQVCLALLARFALVHS